MLCAFFKYCKEATALDCWGSEEWSAKYGETADERERMDRIG